MNNPNGPIVLSNEMENEINIYASKVVPELPKVVDNEQLAIYVSTAGNDRVGVASFNSEDFIISPKGQVSLRVKSGNGVHVEIDDTLTQFGKAADAGAVGVAVEELNRRITAIEQTPFAEEVGF